MRKMIGSVMLVVGLAMGAGGCASVLPIVATVASVASEALAWIEVIESAADARIPESARPKFDELVTKAKAAAAAVMHTGRGAEHFSNEELLAAFDELREAYAAVLDLVEPYGIAGVPDGGGMLGVSPGQVRVPTADALMPPGTGAE